jgi:hypothetical protein
MLWGFIYVRRHINPIRLVEFKGGALLSCLRWSVILTRLVYSKYMLQGSNRSRRIKTSLV